MDLHNQSVSVICNVEHYNLFYFYSCVANYYTKLFLCITDSSRVIVVYCNDIYKITNLTVLGGGILRRENF